MCVWTDRFAWKAGRQPHSGFRLGLTLFSYRYRANKDLRVSDRFQTVLV